MNLFIIFYLLLRISLQHPQPLLFFKAFNAEAYQWIGIPHKNIQTALQFCKVQEFEPHLLQLISKLETNSQNFTISSIQIIQQSFKNSTQLKSAVKCLSSFSHTKIPFLEEKKKTAVTKKYISEYPQYSQKIFHQNYVAEHKGKQLGKWIKGLMQYYYVTHISESQTLSTILLRSLSTKVDVLQNRDFSFCIDLEDVGRLSEELQNMDINNIFLKVPAVFNTLKYLHLKLKCQSQKNLEIVSRLQNKIKDIDMFKIMYFQYEPYVSIATEKYGISKIKLLATQLSEIINNSEEVRKLQIIKIQEQQEQKNKQKQKQKSKSKSKDKQQL